MVQQQTVLQPKAVVAAEVEDAAALGSGVGVHREAVAVTTTELVWRSKHESHNLDHW
jgi:hypothetical protein